MPEANDMELLREYGQSGSEPAFAELVQRHINLVYSVALRHVGITAQAEEITQAVFIILARKAASLKSRTVLEGWLHTTTRLTALSFLRGERRRQFREQEAYMQSTLQGSGDTTNDVTWEQLEPLLDEAVSRLGKKDRDALVLRFFKDRSIREVATALEVNEAAAQRRVLRALEKLRRYFTKCGVDSTTAIISGKISANSIYAAPVTLAQSVTSVAIAKGAVASASTLTLIKGALKLMAWTKAKTTIAIGFGLLLLTGTTAVAVKKMVRPQLPFLRIVGKC
ncbi:MAG TPA: sigma-70 family RNA polymerase sigma factor, partial [Candidatus Binatia bacterium]|nr:sigma-70 family RNA polymerase sigma factor [Candidatus Binatia bacterium]